MSCVFGPVPSRRLGRSLGIDMVPFKTCSYDCSYCHVGRTTVHTIERRQWVAPDIIMRDLTPRLASAPDFITLGGSGEPTLYAGLDDLIARIKHLSRIPIAVITNGSLLWREDVRNELMKADLVVPSLDAGDPATFQRVNRPVPEIDFNCMVNGLIEFRKAFPNRFCLEVMLLGGINDGADSLAALRAWVQRIAPERVHLNTAVRPPADESVTAIPMERLTAIAADFRPVAEVIAETRLGEHPLSTRQVTHEEIWDILRRHPSSLDDVVTGLRVATAIAAQTLESMCQSGLIRVIERAGCRFYTVLGDTECQYRA